MHGKGVVVGLSDRKDSLLDGTSTFRVDFQDRSFTSRLKITGVEVGTSNNASFGEVDFTGFVTGSFLAAEQDMKSLAGQFYGPAAEEIGAVFAAQTQNILEKTTLTDVTLANSDRSRSACPFCHDRPLCRT